MPTYRVTITALDADLNPLPVGLNGDGSMAWLYEGVPALTMVELAAYKGQWLGWDGRHGYADKYVAPRHGRDLPAYIDVDVAEYAANSNQVESRRCETFSVERFVAHSTGGDNQVIGYLATTT